MSRLGTCAGQAIHRLLMAGAAVPDLLWSKGTPAHCDWAGPRWYRLRGTESLHSDAFFERHYAAAHGLVWVRLSSGARVGKPCDLDAFARGALPRLTRPIVLVTTDGDASVPGDLNAATAAAILGSPHVVAWYTQNHDGTRPDKVRPFPIGLDLHSYRGVHSPAALVRALRRIRDRRPPIMEQPITVFCDAHLARSSPDRLVLAGKIAGPDHVVLLERRVPQFEIWRHYAAHPFVLSPAGHGLDCHRCWEALLLGAIVVTRRSSLSPLYEGLAVWEVDEWEEVRDPAALARQRDRLAPLTDRDRVWSRLGTAAWIARIRAETQHA